MIHTDCQTTACRQSSAAARALPGTRTHKGDTPGVFGLHAAPCALALGLAAERACHVWAVRAEHLDKAVNMPGRVVPDTPPDAARDASPGMKSGRGLPTIVTPFGQFAGGAS